jgi:hypothetical protein
LIGKQQEKYFKNNTMTTETLNDYLSRLKNEKVAVNILVDKDGEMITGFDIYCPSILKEEKLEEIRNILPEADVYYLPNIEQIIIEL